MHVFSQAAQPEGKPFQAPAGVSVFQDADVFRSQLSLAPPAASALPPQT